MAISFTTGSTSSISSEFTSVTSQALVLSSSINIGDLVLVGVAGGVTGGGSSTMGLSGGSVTWTSAGTIPLGGGSGFGTGINLNVFWAIATSSTVGATLTGTSSASAQMIVAAASWSGASGVDVFNSGSITGSTGATTLPEPAVTTTLSGDWLIDVLALWTTTTATVTPTYPIDAATQRLVSPATFFQILAFSDSNGAVTVGSIGGGSWTWTGAADGCGATIAIKAAPVPLTVTATQGGSTFNGMSLQVIVLDGATEAGGGSATAYNGSSLPAHATLTPNFSNSYIGWALASDATTGAPTIQANNTFDSGSPFHDTTNANYYSAGNYSGTITSGTGVTVGSSSTVDGGALAAYEVPPNGTISVDPSTPAFATTMTATTVTTASFSVPYGTVLVAIVASDGSGSGAQTISVTDSFGLLWTQRVIANTGTTSYQAAVFTATLSAVPVPPALPGIHFQYAVPALAVPAAIVPDYIPPPSNQMFTQTLLALVAAPAATRQGTAKIITSNALNVTGVVGRSIRHVIAAIIAMIAIVARGVSRQVITNAMSAASGNLLRKVNRTVTAPVTATASTALQKVKSVLLAAIITASPVAARQINRLLTGQTAVNGTYARALGKIVAGALVSGGTLTRGMFRKISAAVAGASVVVRTTLRTFTTPITVTVTLTKRSVKSLTGQTAVQGSIPARSMARTLATQAAVTATAIASRLRLLMLTAYTAVTGLAPKQSDRTLTGGMTTTTHTYRSIGRNLSAFGAAGGAIIRSLAKNVASVIATAGSLLVVKAKFLILTAQVAVRGALSNQTARSLFLSAPVIATVQVSRSAGKILVAAAVAAGSFAKAMSKKLASAVTATASMATNGVLLVLLEAAVAASATVKRGVAKLVVANPLSLLASTGRGVVKVFSGAISASAVAIRNAGKGLTANVAAVSLLSSAKVRLLTLIANVVPGVQVKRGTSKNINAPVALEPQDVRAIYRTIQGTLDIAGQTVRQMARTFSPNIALVVAFQRNIGYIIAAGITMSAAVSRKFAKMISGSVSVTANAAKRISKAITGNAAASSALTAGRVKLIVLAAGISAGASAATQVFRHLVGSLNIRVGVPFARWVTSTIKSFWQT